MKKWLTEMLLTAGVLLNLMPMAAAAQELVNEKDLVVTGG